jgi:hypothetical protein
METLVDTSIHDSTHKMRKPAKDHSSTIFIYLRAILEREQNSSGETSLLSEIAATKLTNAADFKCMC